MVEIVERLRAYGGDDRRDYRHVAAAHIEAQAAQIDALTKERDRMAGLIPELPPFPPEGYGLPRFGLRWNGPDSPLAVPMDDGYWTPYHLAGAYRRDYQDAERELAGVSSGIGSVRWMDPPDGGSVSLGEQVRRMRADLEAAETQVEQMRKALEPFAAYAPYVEMFVAGRAAQGGSPKLPTKHFTLSHFRARTALQGAKDE